MSVDIENILNLSRGPETPIGNVALFIDHDNMFSCGQANGIPRGYEFDILIKKCKQHGRIVFARAYGNLGKIQYELFRHVIEPVYTPYIEYDEGTRKSLADPMMICDILQAFYEKSYIDTFIIATEDRHFIPVLLNLSRYKDKKQVIVIGFDDTASKLLIDACTYLDIGFCDYKTLFEQFEEKYNEGD